MKIVITGIAGVGCSPLVAHMAKLAMEACLSMRCMEIADNYDCRPTYEPRKAIHEPDFFLDAPKLSGYERHHQIGNTKKNRQRNIMNTHNSRKSKQTSKKR